MQRSFPFAEVEQPKRAPPRSQLLKWIGNKQRFAARIAAYFPRDFGTYFEPFLGAGAVLATVAAQRAVAGDVFAPLIEIWQTLRDDPARLKRWYSERWHRAERLGRANVYDRIRAAYNAEPNGADLVYLCRACYGGVVRFRRSDGCMSTPCGPHKPIPPAAFATRVDEWHRRCSHVEFMQRDFADTMDLARRGDLVYCDPPYVDSQSILYGAQDFSIARLFEAIARCKRRGVRVALSIDGSKRSGDKICDVPIPPGLFEVEASVDCGRSMLRRFQMSGKSLESEVVSDRLLLTYRPPSA